MGHVPGLTQAALGTAACEVAGKTHSMLDLPRFTAMNSSEDVQL